jgi:Mitochondrial carrier protein
VNQSPPAVHSKLRPWSCTYKDALSCDLEQPLVQLLISLHGLQVYKGGGVRALFAGAGPRTTRTAAGYAIVTSLFEVFKTYARQSPGIAG